MTHCVYVWAIICALLTVSTHCQNDTQWQNVVSSINSGFNITEMGMKESNVEMLICGNEGVLLRSRDQTPLRLAKRNVVPFNKYRIKMRVALLDSWSGETIWLIVNNEAVWNMTQSWRQHGVPVCLSPYSDQFIEVDTVIDVDNGTSSLDLVLMTNLKSGVAVASFGFTKLQIDVLPDNSNVMLSDFECNYTREADIWFEISSPSYKEQQSATLECANGRQIQCSDWFNHYACQASDGDCPSPRLLRVRSSDSAKPKCCSLGKSCAGTDTLSIKPVQETCEYVYNSIEDTSFIDLKVTDMSKNVSIQCGNNRVFRCGILQWGKYTCPFRDRARRNRNEGNLLCPEPRNAIVNGQCCNLGKGCTSKKKILEPPSDLLASRDLTQENTSSTRSVLLIAAFCGSLAVAVVAIGAVVLYKRSKNITLLYSRLP